MYIVGIVRRRTWPTLTIFYFFFCQKGSYKRNLNWLQFWWALINETLLQLQFLIFTIAFKRSYDADYDFDFVFRENRFKK